MKHITPRGVVQTVGEDLDIFMYDRAINGCWDIPNLYGWRQEEMVSLSLNQDQGWVQHDCALWVPIPWDLFWQQSVSLHGPWDCPSMVILVFYVVMILKIKKNFFLSSSGSGFFADPLIISPVSLFSLNSIFFIQVVRFQWHFTIASQKEIVLKCLNTLTGRFIVVPHTNSYLHTCLYILPIMRGGKIIFLRSKADPYWCSESYRQHMPPKRPDILNSPSIHHLWPSSSLPAGSFSGTTKHIHVSLR